MIAYLTGIKLVRTVMMPHDALEIVNKILEPKRLNYAQEVVLLQSWSGKIYREIASEFGYDLDYIKEVGSQLWNSLSEALGEKVTKKNFKLVLSNLYTNGSPAIDQDSDLISPKLEPLKFPSGVVPLYSSLYIYRPPIEERVYAEIARPGSLIRIKASRLLGKSSLIYRALDHARQKRFHTVMLNLQTADSSVLSDLNQFLRWLCLNVSWQLNLEPRLDHYWNEEIGSKVSCSIYFQEYLLSQLNTPVVLAIDEVNRIFEYPNLARDFLPLLRAWYEEAANLAIWQKLRLIVSHSTEAYVALNINQSPFNVGLPIQLPEFTRSQVQDLVQRYELNRAEMDEQDIDDLIVLVGGHPYLTRLALYWLRQRELTFAQLLQTAPTLSGIYSNHLRRCWEEVQQSPVLWEAIQQIVRSPDGALLESITAYRLESLGLVRFQGSKVIPACDLYRLFFAAQMT
jgi:hypothetical protein